MRRALHALVLYAVPSYHHTVLLQQCRCMVYALVTLTTIATVLVGTVSRSWCVLTIGIVITDGWYTHYINVESTTVLCSTLTTTSGSTPMAMLTSNTMLVAAGIAVAMHGVSSYAHVYMAYEHTSIRRPSCRRCPAVMLAWWCTLTHRTYTGV